MYENQFCYRIVLQLRFPVLNVPEICWFCGVPAAQMEVFFLRISPKIDFRVRNAAERGMIWLKSRNMAMTVLQC
jgi:hypothetical protein